MLTSTPAVRTESLCLARESQLLLRNVNFEIAAGECVAITGNNGVGKTTFLKCLAALIPPTSGTVWWFGQPASKTHGARGKIGMAAHECYLYDQLTVRENLIFAARMYSVLEPADTADSWLQRIGLRSVANRRARNVSRGTRSRLALCRAMIHNPQLLLLDEPFSGLDMGGRNWLVEHLRNLCLNGTAICMVIHDPRLVGRIADRTWLLDKGVFQLQRDAESPKPFDQRVAA